MTVLSSFRRSRVLPLALVALVAVSGGFAACSKDATDADGGKEPGIGTLPPRTPTYVAEVVSAYPHDPDAYTQGLFFDGNTLYESTGLVDKSSVREVELASGRVIRKYDLPGPYFGEGIVLMGNDLIEITWQSGVAFVYDAKTFAKKGEFKYEGEGWGLTTDSTSIVMSDGSAVIRFRDPKTFAVTRSITVSDHGTPVPQLNELEWVKGEIWANVYQTDQIARIDPATGTVTGWIDLSGLLPNIDRTGKEDVLNGIAYQVKGDRIFVTGKLWPKMYEIRLKQRS